MAPSSKTKTDRRFLEFQADRIEAVLMAHRLPSRVSGGTVLPRWLRFFVDLPADAKLTKVRNLNEEIALALGADDARITREGAQLAIEIPRPDPEFVSLRQLLTRLQPFPRLTACLGVSELGHPLLAQIDSPDVAHLLVAGTTGSGKTELMRTILMSLALYNRRSALQMVLIDPKQRGFAPLSGLPHLLTPIITDVARAQDALDWLVATMQRRDRDGVSHPHIVVAVDETPELLMDGGQPMLDALVRLSQRGREAGIHLLLGAQKPSAAVFAGQLRANLPMRLVGRVTSSDDARVATGIGGTGAERLMGRGDFLVVAAGIVTRFQAALVAPEDWTDFHQQIHEAHISSRSSNGRPKRNGFFGRRGA